MSEEAFRAVFKGIEGKTVGRSRSQSGRRGMKEPLDRTTLETSLPNAAGEYSAWESGPDPQWAVFARTYEGSPIVKQDTIYALPEPLIDAILEEMPDFFREGGECFERDLARLAGAGFFLKRPFVYHSLPGPKVLARGAQWSQELDERNMEADAGIRKLLADEMRRLGRSEKEIREYWAAENSMQERIDVRRWGYAGWLATHPDFHRARDKFRRRWQSKIRKQGVFPAIPMSFAGENPKRPEKQDRDMYLAYTMFYRQWGLDSFATWELPRPMRPELVQPSFYPLSEVSEAGITLFMPAYLLRDKDLNVRELIDHKLALMSHPHLNDWLAGKPTNWGHERYLVMLKLYIYLELALKSRYADRLKRRTTKLDHAFGRFLCEDPSITDAEILEAENVRKVRQQMNRRLRKCEQLQG